MMGFHANHPRAILMLPARFLTVTLNPTLDVSTSVARLIDHEKLRCQGEREQVGGGGINVAQVIHSLGAHCQAYLPCGGFRGQDIVKRLQADGMDCLLSGIDQENRQCFTVYESETGHEYRFILPGPTFSNSEWQDAIRTITQHLPSEFLVLSGSLPPGVPDHFYAELIEQVRAQQTDWRMVVDTSGEPLALALAAGVHMIKPSREEFCRLVGHTPSNDVAFVQLCKQLIKQGRTQLIALTLGQAGSLVITADQAIKIHPLPVKVTSTVGAGDSFVGGFIWALAQNMEIAAAARIGTAAATAALQTQGKLQFEKALILSMSQAVRLQMLDLP
jgi:6-phosphofructokinase 2